MRACIVMLVVMAALVFGTTGTVAATDEGFVPQTSSTRTDVPSPSALPAAGAGHVLVVFAGATGLGFAGHVWLRRKRV